MNMDAAITPTRLAAAARGISAAARSSTCAAQPAFDATRDVIPGAMRRAPEAVAAWASELEPWRPVVVYCVHGHEVGAERCARRCASAASTRAISKAVSRRWRAAGGATTPYRAADALGHARAAEDRPHRVPVARAALHRSGGRVLLRADRRGARVRRRATAPRRTTSPDVDVRARRRRMQLRRVHPPARARRPGARRARDDRARRGHRDARPRAAGARAARGVARACRRMFADDHAMLRGACSSTTRSTRGAARRGETHGWNPRDRCAPWRRERQRR